MSKSINNQLGFASLSIIEIISIIAVISIVGYFGVEKYIDYQIKKSEKEQQTQELILFQQEALEEIKQGVTKLKSENIESSQRVSELEQKITKQRFESNNLTIQTSELEPYLTGVVQISCSNTEGSGTLWKGDENFYLVMTNWHVINTPYSDGFCIFSSYNTNNMVDGLYHLDVINGLRTESPDLAILSIKTYKERYGVNPPNSLYKSEKTIPELNYNIFSALEPCPDKMPVGSSVSIIGYPVFGQQKIEWTEGRSGIFSARITTEGIISGYDISNIFENMPYPNYFVSAKIDSGNSGGIALSKNENGLCILGVPTWLTLGNYETQGVIQNIRNIFHLLEK